MSKRRAVSGFLSKQYGIRWSDISSKLRSTLLKELEHVPCNLCGGEDVYPIAKRDKYRLPLTTVLCKGCGLLYLNPRPTAASYRKFYEQGGQANSAYHRTPEFSAIEDLLKGYFGPDFVMDDVARAAMYKYMTDHGVGLDGKRIKGPRRADGTETRYSDEESEENRAKDSEEAEERVSAENRSSTGERPINYYAHFIYDELKDLVPVGGKVFEAGASWGKMLWPWKKLHGCEATGVEPKAASVRAAKARFGMDLLHGFADDPRIPEDAYDLVINTRTINHMLDPIGDLRNSWRWLKPNGILFVDIADATKEARFEGFEQSVVEVDHPYMFSLNTLTAVVQKAGFSIVRREVKDLQQLQFWDHRLPQVKQIRIVARKLLEPVPIDWPNPLEEAVALLTAQFDFDREREASIEEWRQQRSALRKRYLAVKTELRTRPKPNSELGRRLASIMERLRARFTAP